MEKEFTLEPNFIELELERLQSSASNIVAGPNGSVMNGGALQSLNFIAGSAGWKLDANGNLEANSGTFRGALSANTIDIGGSDASSFHVDIDGNMWLGAAAFADGVAKISNAGVGTFSNITITGGSVGGSTTVGISNVNIAARGWTQTSVFSVTDADTVAWAAGTFTSADGTAYSIGAGNTGNMAAATYIYLDTAISTTAYQTTTTAATAVGAGKVLIAKAQNGTGEATFQVFGGIGGQNIDATSIVANSITANELSTSITYAGSIVVDTSGLIRSGQTAYNTGTGWWLGNNGGTPKFSIGDGTTNFFTWDGARVNIGGYIKASQPFELVSYTVANLPTIAVTESTFNSPGTIADDSTVGTVAWSNPTNASSSNNVYAATGALTVSDPNSHYLKATNFGFSIPAGATITGIKVEVETYFTDSTDNSVKIVKGGTISGSNLAAGYTSDAEQYFVYGGANSLWGLTWTVADINASTFGVAFSVSAVTPTDIVEVDHIRIKVYYTESGAVSTAAGSIAYASNGRKNGEGAGAGTGVVVFYDGTAWRACDTGATVAA